MKYFVMGDFVRAGQRATLYRTFHARTRQAAQRYLVRWAEGKGYKPTKPAKATRSN